MLFFAGLSVLRISSTFDTMYPNRICEIFIEPLLNTAAPNAD